MTPLPRKRVPNPSNPPTTAAQKRKRKTKPKPKSKVSYRNTTDPKDAPQNQTDLSPKKSSKSSKKRKKALLKSLAQAKNHKPIISPNQTELLSS